MEEEKKGKWREERKTGRNVKGVEEKKVKWEEVETNSSNVKLAVRPQNRVIQNCP